MDVDSFDVIAPSAFVLSPRAVSALADLLCAADLCADPDAPAPDTDDNDTNTSGQK